MSSLAVQLPEELSDFVQKTIDSGAYHDADEFFASMVLSYKEQTEAPLTEEEASILQALREDVQLAVAQADAGKTIRGFTASDF